MNLVKAEFSKIKNEDILLHNKNVLTNDGFRVTIELSNGSSSVTYQLNTPIKNDDHIEDLKNTASMMLTLVGTTWDQWIK
ncbi:MAG: hypothetical protein M3R08_01245 [Bacteroidota bacterium]|nr:hypothetical protein [Bacteroidota bacterium]